MRGTRALPHGSCKRVLPGLFLSLALRQRRRFAAVFRAQRPVHTVVDGLADEYGAGVGQAEIRTT
jgi:hypothetical protein